MASSYGPAAGTRQGPRARLAILHPPKVISLREDEMTQLAKLQDLAAYGLYAFVLRVLADFTAGEMLVTYAQLQALSTPPRPELGQPRPGPTYAVLRRLLRDLEGVGLVARDTRRNALQGQLRLYLPYPAAAAGEWAKNRAQLLKAQGNAQGLKARKAA